MKPRLRRGATLKTLGRTEEALEAFRKVLLMEPDCQEARQGAQVILRDPAVLMARLRRANVLKIQGRMMEAEEAYTAVLQLQPDCQEATQGLVEIEKTKQEYAKVVEMEPGGHEANKGLRDGQLESGDREITSMVNYNRLEGGAGELKRHKKSPNIFIAVLVRITSAIRCP